MNQITYDVVEEYINQLVNRLWTKLEEVNEGKESGVIFTAKESIQGYTYIYNLCSVKTQDYGQQLYQKFTSITREFLKKRVNPFLASKHQIQLLQEFKIRWEMHESHLRYLNKIFNYIVILHCQISFFFFKDRSHVQNQGALELSKRAKQLFLEFVLEKFNQQLFEAFIYELEKDRNGQETDREVLRSFTSILNELSQYDQSKNKSNILLFVDLIEKSSIGYYKQIHSLHFHSDCADYLQKIYQIITNETRLIEKILEPLQSTIQKIKNKCYEILIKDYKQELINSNKGLCYFLELDQVKNLGLVYKLFNLLEDDFLHIRNKFKEFIYLKGKQLIDQKIEEINKKLPSDQLNDLHFINQLLGLYDKYSQIIDEYCNKNSFFHFMLRDAFEQFINISFGDYGVAEYLSAYADKLLSKDFRNKLDVNDLEGQFNKLIQLFTFLQDKDLFFKSYQNKLSKRLLTERSENLDDEKLIISKIKPTCGKQATQQFEEMIQDIIDSHYISLTFQQIVNEHFDFSIQLRILNFSSWPKYKEFNQQLIDKRLGEAQIMFNNFYNKWKKGYEHRNRQLLWSNALSSVTLICRLKEKYEIQMSMYQAQILYLFNNDDGQKSYSEIKEQLQFDDVCLEKNIHLLKRMGLLISDSKENKISSTDNFKFNENFTHVQKKKKFELPFVFSEEIFKKEQIDQDREIAIEACIVKIMKSRKKMEFQDLVKEISKVLQTFKPSNTLIKGRIEKLIQLEYLERNKNNLNELNYIS